MAITNRSPSPGAVIAHGDTFQFDIDDTYTTVVIKVQTATSLETAYTTAGGGAQPGYTIVVADDGAGTHTFTVGRDSGFSEDPTAIDVVEDETGSSATTSWTYDLSSVQEYPEGMQPYNGVSTGINDPNAIHDNVAGEISPLTLVTVAAGDHILIEDADDSNAKKRIAASDLIGGGSALETKQDGTSLSSATEMYDFLSPMQVTESPADNFTVTTGPQLHSLADNFGGNVVFLWQAAVDPDTVDESGNETVQMSSPSPPDYGAGYVPGTTAGHGGITGARWFESAAAGGPHAMGTGEAMSAYCLCCLSSKNTQTQPYLICSTTPSAANIVWGLYASNGGHSLNYVDSGGAGALAGVYMPRNRWIHAGFTRAADNSVKIYIDGTEVASRGAVAGATVSGNELMIIGAPHTAGSSYWTNSWFSSIKVLDVELTAAQMLQEAKRALGR